MKTYYAPRCYRTSHSNARAICRAYDMDLAMIQSLSEFNSVSDMCKVNDNFLENNLIIDGMSPYSKSKTEWFFTRTGEKMAFSIPWGTGNPDDLGFERCIALGPKGSYLANDIPCVSLQSSFLCEKNEFFSYITNNTNVENNQK